MSTTPPAPAEGSGQIRLALLLGLAMLSTVAPFAIDLYLPAFPAMIADLGTTPTGAQLTLTGFFVGVTLGQLVFGPLSDRFGRIPPLLAGVVLCVIASATAVLAPTIEVLVVARVAQGLGGAAGMVISRAIIADLVRGRAAARTFSLMQVAAGVAPITAPVLGGVFAAPFGWRGLLAIVLGLSCVMLATTLAVVRETYPAERRAAARAEKAQAASARRSLRSRAFLGYVIAFGLAFSTMFAYIAASPFLYQTMMGFSELGFGLLFGLNATALVSMNALNARLTRTVPVNRLLWSGMFGLMGSAAVFGLMVLLSLPAVWLAAPIFTLVGSFGLVLGNATALALSIVPQPVTGTASAMLGATQFGLAAAVAPLVGIAGERTAMPVAIVIAVCASGAALALRIAQRPPGPWRAQPSASVAA